MADRFAWWCPSATPGRVPSGWKGSSGCSSTGWDSGRSTATTTARIPGRKSATGSYTRHRGAHGALRGGTLHQPFEPDLGNASGGMHMTTSVDLNEVPSDQFLKVETHGIDAIPDAERHGRPREPGFFWASSFVKNARLLTG